MSDAPRSWSARTTMEAGARDGSVALLPLAAIEQHGPHLPLSTDLDIALGILAAALERVEPRIDLRVLPPQAFGTSVEHDTFPGTLGLPAGLFEATLVELGRAVARAGGRRLVLFNAHGGNRAAMDTAALRLRREEGLLVVKASWFRFPRPDAPELRFPEAEWRHGLHGGAIETSMMLHLHPDRVRIDRLDDFRSTGEELESALTHLGPEGVASFAWLAEDLNAMGVTGTARDATVEAGRALVEHYGAVLAEVIHDAAHFPLDRLAEGVDGRGR